MSKLVPFFLLGFLFISILGGVMQGGGGPNTTRLTAALTATATTVPVVSTANFLNIDYILIDNEKILYSSKDATNFYVASNGRGYDSTAADSHTERTNVHSPEAGILNSMASYKVSAIIDASGVWAIIKIPVALFTLIGNALWINFSFLGTDLAILSYIWMILGIGLVVSLIISLR